MVNLPCSDRSGGRVITEGSLGEAEIKADGISVGIAQELQRNTFGKPKPHLVLGKAGCFAAPAKEPLSLVRISCLRS